MPTYGLIGYPLSHSFSKQYFEKKFELEHIRNTYYQLFELADSRFFPLFLAAQNDIYGLNVTTPHKQSILDHCHILSEEVQAVEAANTLKIAENGEITAYNTDIIGFEQSILPILMQITKPRALVLGNGGASKAVQYVLSKRKIPFTIISRSGANKYIDINKELIESHLLIINTTTLGMHPNVDTSPDVPYQWLTPQHFCYDLVYNPAETLFLKNAKNAGSGTKNGLEMLHLQAEAAWEIWNS